MTTEIVYLGHDNSFKRQLLSDEHAIDLTAVSRITLKLDKNYDSADSYDGNILLPGLGLEAGDGMDISTGDGQIIFRLGGQDIPPGRYAAEITIYDDTNNDGIVFPTFPVSTVKH